MRSLSMQRQVLIVAIFLACVKTAAADDNDNNTWTYNGIEYTPGSPFTFPGTAHGAAGDYIFTGVASMLSIQAMAGDTSLFLDTTDGFVVADFIMIGNIEIERVTAVTPTSLQIASAIQNTFAVGSDVIVISPAPAPGAGGATGDPLATYGNKRVEFLLPVGVPKLLFESSYMKVLGTTFEGSQEQEQWIDRVIVTTKEDEKIIDMSIKKDLMHFNRSRLPPNSFETLNIVMWQSRPTPLKAFPPPDGYFYHAGVTVAFLRQNWDRERDAPNRECAWIGTALTKLVVCSASAREYFGEQGFGGRKYAHLDLEFDDMHNEKGKLTGLLPELWGMVPRSEDTRSCIKNSYEISEPFLAAESSQNGTVDLPQASSSNEVSV